MIRLASKSPRRQELLKMFADFAVTALDTDESVAPGASPEDTVLELALRKARAVSRLYPEDVIIGADTVVTLGNRILGKPAGREEAREMLRSLSGTSHTVHTGVAVLAPDRMETMAEATRVVFYPLTDFQIDEYLDTDEPYDKAGAYAIQGKGALLVKEIHGDFYNVMGLPVSRLSRLLRDMLVL